MEKTKPNKILTAFRTNLAIFGKAATLDFTKSPEVRMNFSSFFLSLSLMSAIASPCFALDEIPMVGLDDAGTPVTYVKSKNEYITELKAMASAVDDSILPSLETKNTKWMLRTVVVGLGLGVEVGVGPVIKLKASPRFRLIYSNSKDPVAP